MALGFIAAGPWDESSLRDIREDSIVAAHSYDEVLRIVLEYVEVV